MILESQIPESARNSYAYKYYSKQPKVSKYAPVLYKKFATAELINMSKLVSRKSKNVMPTFQKKFINGQ